MKQTFGAIDATQIIEHEFRIGMLERILERMVENNSNLVGPNPPTIDQIKRALQALPKRTRGRASRKNIK